MWEPRMYFGKVRFSPVNSNDCAIPRYGYEGPTAEERQRAQDEKEAKLDAHNPLMCKFTKRVIKALEAERNQVMNAEGLTMSDCDIFTMYEVLIHYYKLRLYHFQHCQREHCLEYVEYYSVCFAHAYYYQGVKAILQERPEARYILSDREDERSYKG